MHTNERERGSYNGCSHFYSSPPPPSYSRWWSQWMKKIASELKTSRPEKNILKGSKEEVRRSTFPPQATESLEIETIYDDRCAMICYSVKMLGHITFVGVLTKSLTANLFLICGDFNSYFMFTKLNKILLYTQAWALFFRNSLYGEAYFVPLKARFVDISKPELLWWRFSLLQEQYEFLQQLLWSP